MLRITHPPRADWKHLAVEYGFKFHTMHGEPYWDESAYYQFTLKQIEQDLEAPTAEIHQMCLAAVEYILKDEQNLIKMAVPEWAWQAIYDAWKAQAPSLYSRLDFVYDGRSCAKLLENNADTPTSLYEAGFWQWLWLEHNVDKNALPKAADQFNSLQEKLVSRFKEIAHLNQIHRLHFSCCKDSEEDRGTVQYLQDCAKEAGIEEQFIFMEDIGLSVKGEFTDLQDLVIQDCFKLYPWEFMLDEEFGKEAVKDSINWIEPLWKTLLSNKGLLAILWEMFPNHPNLLPTYFSSPNENNGLSGLSGEWIKKPLFSREGANISLINSDQQANSQLEITLSEGPYGNEGFVVQQRCALPVFSGNHTLIGSWLVDDQPAGITIREDKTAITQDSSRFLPHVIL
jgi:glutathionylspermidine synthase